MAIQNEACFKEENFAPKEEITAEENMILEMAHEILEPVSI